MQYGTWTKSTASNGSGNCVEVRHEADATYLRDSKDAGMGPTLTFTPAEWDAFLVAAKDDEFDR